MSDMPQRFVDWLAAQDTVPGLSPEIVARIKAALPPDPMTTGLARGEEDLWSLTWPHFKMVERGAAHLTLRALVIAWRTYQTLFYRAQREADRKAAREERAREGHGHDPV
jgi:hypothetical protein